MRFRRRRPEPQPSIALRIKLAGTDDERVLFHATARQMYFMAVWGAPAPGDWVELLATDQLIIEVRPGIHPGECV